MKSAMNTVVLGILMLGFTTASVFASEGNFKKRHPLRAEVVGRANHEEKRNDAAAASGQITAQQAKKLDRQDQRIKKEEQADAAAHGGTITKDDQRELNRQENRVNRERTRMEKRDAAKAGGAVPATPATPAVPAPATTN